MLQKDALEKYEDDLELTNLQSHAFIGCVKRKVEMYITQSMNQGRWHKEYTKEDMKMGNTDQKGQTNGMC